MPARSPDHPVSRAKIGEHPDLAPGRLYPFGKPGRNSRAGDSNCPVIRNGTADYDLLDKLGFDEGSEVFGLHLSGLWFV